MNAPFSQATRLGQLHTVLGPDALVLQRFDGAESVNALFEWQVEALSSEPSIDFDGLIGTHASIELETNQHGPRFFDGIVTEARWTGVGENGNTYRLALKPWAWLAGRRRNQRIFHNKTVEQILQDVFADWAHSGDAITELRLSESYPVLEYTVQYR